VGATAFCLSELDNLAGAKNPSLIRARAKSAIIRSMVPGAPREARWAQPVPKRSYSTRDIERLLHSAFPRFRVTELRRLDGGLRNANLRLRLDSSRDQIVLRIYQHEASICQKEVDLNRLVAGSVSVPEIIHAAPQGLDGFPPFVVMRFVEGISYRELTHSGNAGAIAQAARSAGETLAAIGRFTFPKSGWLGPGPSAGPPLLEGDDPMPRFVDLCLASRELQARMPENLRQRTSALMWSAAPELARLGESHLVHGDFNKRNLLVRQIAGKWSVAAVLDWEFAISASPLNDVGNFLRYERSGVPRAEPHFSAGFVHAGGALPQDWRRVARLVDLTALCESLTHDSVPDSVAVELVELVRATVESRDPQLA
jgi:aminoglycoside phosphotransferase (APT) family kinase protein